MKLKKCNKCGCRAVLDLATRTVSCPRGCMRVTVSEGKDPIVYWNNMQKQAVRTTVVIEQFNRSFIIGTGAYSDSWEQASWEEDLFSYFLRKTDK